MLHIGDSVAMSGQYQITATDRNGKIRGFWCVRNQLTKINIDIRTDMLQGVATGYAWDDLAIRYFAFGDGTAPAAMSDTRLANERFRKPITQMQKPNDTTIQSIVNLLTEEANFNIREIGVFCSSSATADADTGILLSRVNVNIDKNDSIVLNVIRQDVIRI
ncbi:phage tail protein [Ruminococcaceae bacterium OttesenSCG-928-D13]|nr:phage tail protein [Ruminococcaceae bacterium OttesenSCG-928-D13]